MKQANNRNTPNDVLPLLHCRQDIVGIMGEDRPRAVRCNAEEFTQHLNSHLDGTARMGVYNVLDGDVCRFAVIDFDAHGDATEEYREKTTRLSLRLQELLASHNIHCHREISKGGYGNYHCWVLFEAPVPAARIRGLFSVLAERIQEEESGRRIQIEIFPKQDRLNGGVGNFIWLPRFKPDVEQGRTIFIDREGNAIHPAFEQTSVISFEKLEGSITSRLDPRISEFIEVRPQGIAELMLTDIPEGGRNNAMIRIAGYFRARDVSHAMTRGVLLNFNQSLSVPLPESEVDRCLRSAYKYPVERTEAPFRYFNGKELLTLAVPPQCNLVEGLIEEQSLTMICGTPNSGKSMLAINLALGVATGSQRFLSFPLKKSGKVLFINLEDPFPAFVRRFKTMLKGLPSDQHDRLENLVLPESAPAFEDYFDELDRLCSREHYALIVIDCLYMAHNQKENDSSDQKQLIRRLKLLRERYKLAIVVIHHTRKGSESQPMHMDNMRGTNVYGASPDTLIEMRRSSTDPSKRLFKPTKLRYAADTALVARLLCFNPETFWFADEGTVNERDHIRSAERHTATDKIDITRAFNDKEEMQAKEIVDAFKPLNYSDKTVRREIDKAMITGRIVRIKNGVYRINRDGRIKSNSTG